MRRTSALLAALLSLLPALAAARNAPNPPGRALLAPAGGVASPGRGYAAVPVRTEAVPVPLPAGAVQVDSIWYDLQDMGSLGSRIAVAPDGRVHIAWQDDFCELAGLCPPNLAAPQPYPQRGMAYATRDPGTLEWTHLGKVQDPGIRNVCGQPELFGGFGNLALLGDGRVAIAQHMNEDGLDLRGNFYLNTAPLSGTFDVLLARLSSGDSYLFPQVAASTTGRYVVVGEVPVPGLYDETRDSRVAVYANGTVSATCSDFRAAPWAAYIPTSLFRDGQGAFPSIAAAADGRIGIAIGDFGGNVYLVESSNGSFSAGTVTIRNLTNYTDAQVTVGDSTSAAYRSYVNCNLAYQDTTPNVVWTELQARKEGTTINYYDYRSRIMHWSSTRGASVVYRVVPGQADHFDDFDLGLNGPLGGFNTVSVDWPQVGFSPDGSEIYVAFQSMSDAEVDPTADMGLPGIVTGIGFADIVACVAVGAGGFSPPQNLTNTPQTDERFFSLATRNPDGRAHIVFQASATNQAGCALIGDRGTAPGNLLRRIAYMEPKLTASTVDVAEGPPAAAPALRSWPNPARGAVRFALGTGSGGGTVQVFSVNGRLVARVPLGPDGRAEWDGKDARGLAAPDGVYLARVEGRTDRAATKFMLLR